MMDVRPWNVPMWSSAPASKSCLYGSCFVFEGNHWPLKEAKCRLPGCLLGHDGPQASAERERMAEFFFLSPVTSYLYQALKSWAESRLERKASTKQWIQRSSVKAASVMTVCRSEGWHSYSDKPFYKQWEHSGGDTIQRLFLSDVLHKSWAWVHQKGLWIFTKLRKNRT